MGTEELTKEEQLAVADAMVAASRKRFKRVLAPTTIMWGYLLLVVSLAVFVVTHCLNEKRGYFIWFAMLVIGFPLAYLIRKRNMKTAVTRSRVDEMVGSLWMWVGITAALSALLGEMTPPAIAMVLAVGFGATGAILRLRAVSWVAVPFILIALVYVSVPMSWVGLEYAVLGALPMIIIGHWLQKGR